MPALPVKGTEQQAILSVHRAPQGFVKARARTQARGPTFGAPIDVRTWLALAKAVPSIYGFIRAW
jgi:hypothetical protein